MKPHKISSNQKNLVFYHMMGQHSNYIERYPAEFEYFKPADYPSLSDEQAVVIASYDNATLYNDYVVDSLISMYKNQESMIFYFPDHGLDLYVSDPQYEGHARQDAASYHEGIQIPFFVYVSPSYQQRFTDIMSRVRYHAEIPFNTNQFIRLITELSGYAYL